MEGFKGALVSASPLLLGLGTDLSGRTTGATGQGAALMAAEHQRTKRKAAIDGLMDRMGIAGPKRDLLATLPVEAQQQQLLGMMQPAPPVAGKVIGDNLVNPHTGKVMGNYGPKPMDLSGIFGSPQGNAVKAGLMSRGVPEHVADAFVVNAYDESGLDSGINERNPTVPGSRGGFGLMQWTGPRRKQLEAFAAQRGTSVDDMDTQLDFIVAEMTSTESAAGKNILTAPDTATAAKAIVNDFLRPAEDNRAKRDARYSNLDAQIGKITQVLASGNGTPAQREALEFRRGRLIEEQGALKPSPADEYQRYAQEERASGREPLSRIDYAQAKKGEEVVYGPDGQPIIVRGPAGTNQKFNEVESKTNLYYTRAKGALDVLDPIANTLTNTAMRAVDTDPTGLVRGAVQSDEFQVAKQAGEEFLLSILRKDTGAAVTPSEEVLYGRTYLPRPGDSQAVLETKAEARQRALAAIEAGMSPAQIIAAERALGIVDVPDDTGEQPPPPPEGFSPDEWQQFWDVMPEEDRALFR